MKYIKKISKEEESCPSFEGKTVYYKEDSNSLYFNKKYDFIVESSYDGDISVDNHDCNIKINEELLDQDYLYIEYNFQTIESDDEEEEDEVTNYYGYYYRNPNLDKVFEEETYYAYSYPSNSSYSWNGYSVVYLKEDYDFKTLINNQEFSNIEWYYLISRRGVISISNSWNKDSENINYAKITVKKCDPENLPETLSYKINSKTEFFPRTLASKINTIKIVNTYITDFESGDTIETISTIKKLKLNFPYYNTIKSSCFQNYTGLVSIELPDTLETIETDAFKGCTSLKSITIPNSITEIKSSAFEGCTGLESVELFNCSYGSKVYKGCTGLTSVIFSGATTLGSYIFQGCTGLTSIVIPNTVTELKTFCLSETGITSITIPSTINKTELGIIYGCPNLTEINIQKGFNPTYHTDGTFIHDNIANITINYEGTIEEFANSTMINRSGLRNASAIHCSDGDCDYTGNKIIN